MNTDFIVGLCYIGYSLIFEPNSLETIQSNLIVILSGNVLHYTTSRLSQAQLTKPLDSAAKENLMFSQVSEFRVNCIIFNSPETVSRLIFKRNIRKCPFSFISFLNSFFLLSFCHRHTHLPSESNFL